jgi:hypothetical protein
MKAGTAYACRSYQIDTYRIRLLLLVFHGTGLRQGMRRYIADTLLLFSFGKISKTTVDTSVDLNFRIQRAVYSYFSNSPMECSMYKFLASAILLEGRRAWSFL